MITALESIPINYDGNTHILLHSSYVYRGINRGVKDKWYDCVLSTERKLPEITEYGMDNQLDDWFPLFPLHPKSLE